MELYTHYTMFIPSE